MPPRPQVMGGHRGRGRQLPAQLGHLALALGLVTQGPPPRTHSASQTHKYNPTLLHDILPGTFFKKANLISLIHILYHALTQSVQFNTNIVTDMRNHHHNQFTSKIKYKEKILKTAREKQKLTYKGIPIRLTADLSEIGRASCRERV